MFKKSNTNLGFSGFAKADVFAHKVCEGSVRVKDER